jgi:hypothetical protein
MTDPARYDRKSLERISVPRFYRERNHRTQDELSQTGEEFFSTSPPLPKGD